MFELALGLGLSIVLIAFFVEFLDSTIGMGYGTTLSPVLLLMGFTPLQVVPALLLAELVTGLFGALMHHKEGNVHLRPVTIHPIKVARGIWTHGFWKSFHLGIPPHLKVVIIMLAGSIIGTIAAVTFAVNIPAFYLKLYIGILVVIIGIIILLTMNKTFKFSWVKLASLGFIASFNKGSSGGGFGPIVTAGQLVAGIEGKNAIGISALAEGLSCIVGVMMYFLTQGLLDWTLAPYLIIGGVLSVPLSARTVKKMQSHRLKGIVGIAAIVLGLITIYKTLM